MRRLFKLRVRGGEQRWRPYASYATHATAVKQVEKIFRLSQWWEVLQVQLTDPSGATQWDRIGKSDQFAEKFVPDDE